jgi:hypothetical protein
MVGMLGEKKKVDSHVHDENANFVELINYFAWWYANSRDE